MGGSNDCSSSIDFRIVQGPHRPEKATEALQTLSRPDNDFSAGLVWGKRDAENWTVFQVEQNGEYAGVIVACLDKINAGRVLEVIAVKCEAGRYADAIRKFLRQKAKDCGCAAIRFDSHRRGVDRLVKGLEPTYVTYFDWLKNAQ